MRKLFLSTIVALFFSLLGCHTRFKPLEYRKLDNFKVEIISLKKIVVKTDLVLRNPNSFGVDLMNSDFNIYINDRILGNSKQIEPIRVNRISEFLVPLEVEVETGKVNLSFLKGMWDNMQNGKVKITIVGNCHIRKMAIPFSLPINYSDTVDLKIPNFF